MDHDRHLLYKKVSRARTSPERGPTSVERHLCDPLLFNLLIPTVLAPSVDPLLLLLVPFLLIPDLMLDTLRRRKGLPFRLWFGFGQGLGAGELVFRRWELCEGAVRRGASGKGEEVCEKGLHTITGKVLEVVFEVRARDCCQWWNGG